MIPFDYTLVAEGSSDTLLLHVIDWLWTDWPDLAPTGRFFDPGKCGLRRGTLTEKICHARKYFPCEVLFVHRDADSSTVETREKEILNAVGDCGSRPLVCVIPVRTTEAWLLFDEKAIRMAAGNPNGKNRIDLPSLKDCESTPDPKDVLFQALKNACGLRGRRLKQFSEVRARARIAELISDFSPLRQLAAFRKLEADMGHVAEHLANSPIHGHRHV